MVLRGDKEPDEIQGTLLKCGMDYLDTVKDQMHLQEVWAPPSQDSR